MNFDDMKMIRELKKNVILKMLYIIYLSKNFTLLISSFLNGRFNERSRSS